MKRKLLSTILVFCVILTLLSITALAEDPPTSGTCGNGVTWKYEPEINDRGGSLIISGKGAMEDYSLTKTSPWRYNYYITTVIIEDGVVSIGDYAFESCRTLKNITIPNSVADIGDCAFRYCVKLTDLIIPSSVNNIGDRAFYNCNSLTDVIIPSNVTNIGEYAFSSCAELSSVTLQNGVRSLGRGAFSVCPKLSQIAIPASVIRGVESAFGSTNLLEIVVDLNNTEYASQDGALLNKEKSTLIFCPQGKASYSIPASVTTIASGAFAGSQLTTIEIPSNVTTIGNRAFQGCTKLTSIVIPNSVTYVGTSAFENCTALQKATLSGAVTIENGFLVGGKFYSDTFTNCTSLATVVVPEGVSELGGTFNGCINLTNISLPVSLKHIYGNTFANCTNLKMIAYAGTETQWGSINIASGNQELGLATIIYNSTELPDTPNIPDVPTIPVQPDTPSTPGTLTLSTANGGLGKKVTVTVTGGHWLTVQVRRAGSVAISSLQAPGSGTVSVTFSAATGSTIQVWETAEEMRFTNGVPDNQILNVVTKEL